MGRGRSFVLWAFLLGGLFLFCFAGLITGDFVDEDTSKENMIAACRALGQLDTPYGVYDVSDGTLRKPERDAYL